MIPENVLEMAEREFRQLKTLADRAIERLDDDQFFSSLDSESNSIAISIKHVAGNLKSRWTGFLTTDGEKPDRDRDKEFMLIEGDTRQTLMNAWEHGWQCLFETLARLNPDNLTAEVQIRGESLSVVQAIGRQLTHYAYHVGQIVLLAKHLTGSQWTTLSVARGGSSAFNAAPRPYISENADESLI